VGEPDAVSVDAARRASVESPVRGSESRREPELFAYPAAGLGMYEKIMILVVLASSVVAVLGRRFSQKSENRGPWAWDILILVLAVLIALVGFAARAAREMAEGERREAERETRAAFAKADTRQKVLMTLVDCVKHNGRNCTLKYDGKTQEPVGVDIALSVAPKDDEATRSMNPQRREVAESQKLEKKGKRTQRKPRTKADGKPRVVPLEAGIHGSAKLKMPPPPSKP
jgi:hypothetical protein